MCAMTNEMTTPIPTHLLMSHCRFATGDPSGHLAQSLFDVMRNATRRPGCRLQPKGTKQNDHLTSRWISLVHRRSINHYVVLFFVVLIQQGLTAKTATGLLSTPKEEETHCPHQSTAHVRSRGRICRPDHCHVLLYSVNPW
jgi:hypothetical protein